jgi:3-keto-5-aminohexanoate cleavage enzyme
MIQTVAAATGADAARTGFEDTIHLPNGDVAPTNADLVEALVRIVRGVGREVASPAEARCMLNLEV